MPVGTTESQSGKEKKMVEHEDVIDIVEELIETCRDGEKGYRDAAEHVKSSELKTFFNEQSRERARFASELQAILPQLGKTEVTSRKAAPRLPCIGRGLI